MYHTTTAHTDKPGMMAKSAFVMFAAIASLILIVSGPLVAKAATVPSFPRLAVWWADASTQSAASLARADWIALQNHDANRIPALRAANPSIIILGTTDATDINYYLSDYNHSVNVELRTVSTDWMLTQVGSTLTAAINASTTSITVADPTKFAVGEMALVYHELVHIDAINGSVLTVTARGPVNPPATHAAGTRIASVVTAWPGTITMDLSSNCPKRDVGYGLETWGDWNTRRGQGILNAAPWDGLFIDVLSSNVSWMVDPSRARSIDALRTNTPVTDGYAALNSAWNAGAIAYGNSMRAMAGTRALIGNGNMRNFNLNGNAFEEFPYTNIALATWNIVFVGPYAAPHASYAEWASKSALPNLTLIQTYGAANDYQLMRFGLTSALMSDGTFSYARSSWEHSWNGLDWFDEYDNAGAGRGYLGQPTGPMAKAGNAWRRDFTSGIALVNPTASAVTVQLGGTYRKIKGTQAPSVNDGTDVTSVTLQPRDGIVLLKIAPVLPPADTTAPVTNSDAKATYLSSAIIKLSATDNVGVTATYFTLDGGVQTAGTTINVTAPGAHTIQFWSVDAAGNIEARTSASFTITVPVPAGTMIAAAGADQVASADISIASAITGATEMRIDPGTGVFGPWIAYAATAQITLPNTGINTVRVEYRNAGGTLQLMDLVELTAPPVEPVVPPAPVVPPVEPVVPPAPVVPPVEPAVPPAPVVPSVIATPNLQGSPSTLDYGASGTLTIAVNPGYATIVRVEKFNSGTGVWSTVATLTTDASGLAQLAVTPLVSTQYRTVLVETGAVSATVTITVQPRVTIRSSKRIVRRTSHVVVSGVVGAASKVTVLLQRSVRGAWRTVRRVRTSSAGRYAARVGFSRRGAHSYRIVLATKATHVRVSSSTLQIQVR